MRSTMRLAWILAAALVPVACGGGSPKSGPEATKTEPKKDAPDPKAATPADSTPPAADAEPTDDPLAGIDTRVQRAAMLAKKIEAEPEKAGDILDAAGLARDEFEDLIFEISTDPGLAKQYEAAILAQTS
jgi:hypothetical protein